MDISLLSEQSIRVRGKLGSFIVDPSSEMQKNPADGILLQNPDSKDEFSKVENYRIVIRGPGDYEVGGIKVGAVRGKENLLYRLNVDDVTMLLGKASELSKEDKIDACDILVLNVDSSFDESLIAKIDPKVVILYGMGAKEALGKLGRTELVPVKKFAAIKDKLPIEMEVVVLG